MATRTSSKRGSTAAPIVVSDLHKQYRRGSTLTPVLNGIDFVVEPGECVFLVGPSGSGKSTLLSILGCVLTPDRGTVHILGENLGLLDARRRTVLRRNRIGFVFQKFNLIHGLTALDNVCVPLFLQGARAAPARRRALELLERVGLADKVQSHPRNMSTGQCQRVALARALACNPDLILADEPTASLDAKTGLEAMTLLRDLTRREGKTAIVVTHDSRILSFADRVCHLENGRLQTDPTIHESASLGQLAGVR